MPTLSSTPVKPAAEAHQAPWLIRHRQQVLLALAATVVAVVLSAFVVSRLERRGGARAWEQLSSSMALASQGRGAEALRSLDALLVSPRSEALSVQGQLMKSDLLIEEGRGSRRRSPPPAKGPSGRRLPPEYIVLAAANLAYVLEEPGDAAGGSRRLRRFHQGLSRPFPRRPRLRAVGADPGLPGQMASRPRPPMKSL